MSRVRTGALALVTAAALVPLFGDPRVTLVTHPLWARMLLRALEMNETVRATTQASEVFSALSWRDSLTFAADRYVRADGVMACEHDGVRCVTAGEGTGELVYPLGVIRAGDYRVRVRLAGAADRPATAEIVPAGRQTAVKTFTFVGAPTVDWVRGGPAHLDPGSYTATVLLPRGSALEYVEVAPPCLDPIEPLEGWKPAAPATVDDVAVTMLQAMDVEGELPPADTPLERTGGDFQLDRPEEGTGQGFEALVLKAERDGLEAVLTVDLPEAGLYTLSAYTVTGRGQRWLADGCRKAILCPSEGAGWRVLMSQSFAAGRHTLTVALAEGAVVERIRLERKKTRAGDYLATVRRLGFDPGPDGPVSRDKAAAAVRFIQDQRRLRLHSCGDISLPEPVPAGLTADLTNPASPTTAPSGPYTAASVPSPIDTVLLPPQQLASPVTPLLAGVARPSS